ncbi:unnamed protein product [Prunus armeniaca]
MQHEKTLQVKKYEGEHTCGIVWENPTVKSSWLNAKYMETLKHNPSGPVSSFMEIVEKDYNTGVFRQQVYRAKKRALRQIEGIYIEQYSRIWDYCEELRKTNPGTTIKVQCDFNEQLSHPVFQSEHRFCARHLFTNFILQFKGKALYDKFWGAAKATTVPQFARQMKELKNLDMDAYAWLTEPEKPPRHWSRSHFSTHVKCDMLLNNMCESFNSFKLACRDKPILSILEIVRCKLMRRIQGRRDKMKNWTKEICPKIFKKIEINKAKVGGCVTMWSGGGKFQVGSGGISQYIVDLDLRTCSCREWDLTSWPCVHGVAAINYNGGLNVMDYVDACYHTQTYFKAYENLILPMNRMELWDRTNMPPCVPHSYSKQPKRPRKARRKEAGECSNKANVVTKVQDSLRRGQCGRKGHNKRTCHRNLPPKTKNKKEKG